MDKRTFPRLKKRLMVEFVVDGEKHTGFTHDVSYTGFFVVTNTLPTPGAYVTATLHLTDGKRVDVHGHVVRARRVPPALTQSIANGFSLQLGGYSEEYTRFVGSLH